MESSSCVSEMTPEEEMAVIREIIDSSESRVKEGDSFYLITLRWWQEWLDYVHRGISGVANNASSSCANDCELEDSTISKRPSRIDNSELIYDMACEEEPETSAELHDSLTEGHDFILLPEEVWKQLYIWYGGGPTLSRKVISSGSPETGLCVEIYLLRLLLILMPKGEQAFIRISKQETIGELCKRACDIFDLTADQICIWNYYGHKKQALMNDMDKTLNDANIKMDQEILLELNDDGVACGGCMSSVQDNGSAGKESASLLAEPCKSNVSIAGGLSASKGVTRSCSSEISQSQFLASPMGEVDGSEGTNGVVVRGSTGGLTGLLNLGNTCFMNSAIQCLVHTPEFARYFREDYHQEINWQNPLGMVGELAMAFGELLRKLWSPGRAPVSPRPFKTKLARFAPQFSGYNQHDSQELLAFLLDGLHEDLNRVKFKPYIKSKDADGRPDEEVADEYWANHIARNDSIIVDVCQGQYKSTLVCPVCGKVSITFDPFMYLSLPLPSTKTRSMTLMVFTSDGSALPTPCTVTVAKHGKCKDLIQAVSSACSLKTGEKLLLAEIRSHLIHRFLDDPLVSLSTIKDDDHLAAYKLPKFEKNTTFLQLIHRRQDVEPNNAHSKMVWKPYGTPLVAPILQDVNTRGDIQKIVRVMLAPMRRAERSEPSEPEKAKVAAEQVSEGLHGRDECSACPMGKEQNGQEEASSIKLPLQLVDENNVCIDLSIGEDKPIRLSTSSSSILVFIDWSEKDLEKYDTHYLDNLPEVFKYGNVNKKSRTEPRAESLSLYTCLEAFLREEPLVPEDMWYCPQCKERRQASKKLDLWRLPEVLVIHLKRFSYSRSVKHKLENFVNFPIHDLDLTNYVANKNSGRRQLYELYALSNHYGGMGSGHYTAHIKILEENRWYNFDDSHISTITEEEVKSAAAYVFFYRRVKGEAGSTSNGSISPAEQEKLSCKK
ncbi:ubiquitin carboxyl-terminal hydrolase 5 [Nymphaea colorata]|nr:ubiquitin carboxyl-terminal hydrolase 5 [Nymphaea colorata]